MAKCINFSCIGKQIKTNTLARNFTMTTTTTTTSNNETNTSQQFTTVIVDEKTGIATLTLNRPPANALNTPFMYEIQCAIKNLEQSKCRGLILTSASNRIFSAGLDLKECYKPNSENLAIFWSALQNLWQTLFLTPLTNVALINGHAIAGGCMLAICSEYRIMLPNFRIGINETQIGLAVPMWLIESYVNVMPSRRIAELDLTSSRIYSSKEALQVGLIDELIVSKEEALEKCISFIQSFDQCTLAARAITKQQFRKEIVKNFEKNRQNDLDTFVSAIQKPRMQTFLGEYLQGLTNKKKAKE